MKKAPATQEGARRSAISERKSGRGPQISVRNMQRKIALDRDALEQFARRALRLCLTEKSASLTNLSEISVLLISDRKMSELHRRFMQISGPTDVIAFQHGEIFISVETARRQARMYRASLVHELRLYLVHGLLHLQGFDDRDPAARQIMGAIQERIVMNAGCSLGDNSKKPL
jgi:probable rRNA maturation factor